MTKFKVGDKVRILDVKSIDFGRKFWLNGDVTKVTDVEVDGGVYLATPCSKGRGLYVTKAELRHIDLVPHSSTRNQRLTDAERTITALESEVAELKAKVEALEKAQLSGPGTVYLHGKPIGKIDAIAALSKSPNEQRKAIIAEAKAFYIDTLNEYQLSDGEVVVIGNGKERSISVTIRHLFSLKPLLSGKSKCAPDDVFNADIGKAIALGRALGLDVSRFEQAVKPTEVVVGQVVKDGSDGAIYNVVPEFSMDGGVLSVDFCRQINRRLAIIDDTEAIY